MSTLDFETRRQRLISSMRTVMSYEDRENKTIMKSVEPGFLEELNKRFRGLPEWLTPGGQSTVNSPKTNWVESTTEMHDANWTAGNQTATVGGTGGVGSALFGNSSDAGVGYAEDISFDWSTFAITFVIGEHFFYRIFS